MTGHWPCVFYVSCYVKKTMVCGWACMYYTSSCGRFTRMVTWDFCPVRSRSCEKLPVIWTSLKFFSPYIFPGSFLQPFVAMFTAWHCSFFVFLLYVCHFSLFVYPHVAIVTVIIHCYICCCFTRIWNSQAHRCVGAFFFLFFLQPLSDLSTKFCFCNVCIFKSLCPRTYHALFVYSWTSQNGMCSSASLYNIARGDTLWDDCILFCLARKHRMCTVMVTWMKSVFYHHIA